MTHRRIERAGLVALSGIVLVMARPSSAEESEVVWQAAALYDRYCSACHGTAGAGDGPGAALLWPRPRDFTKGEYKWRSTASGHAPRASDLAKAIRYGAKGTSMPAFENVLPEAAIDKLAHHLLTFAEGSAPMEPAKVSPPNQTKPDLVRGETLFLDLGCAQCHGTSLRGDGPSAKSMVDTKGTSSAPYDLTDFPLRRPHAEGESVSQAIYASLVTGLSATPMPSYEGAASPEDLYSVSAYVASRMPVLDSGPRSSAIAEMAISIDKKERLMSSGLTIAPQGPAPATLAPAQASLHARPCARCHASQYRGWSTSVHAQAASPGLMAQLYAMDRQGKKGSVKSCQKCHNPLAEQRPSAMQPAATDAEALRLEGINCASCHLRKWTRHGPPKLRSSTRLDNPSYPARPSADYERSDFCMPCHQLPAAQSIAGKPLLNTYKEWLEGPYMARGFQCQHCHMPDREHSWKGVHDPATFRQGISVQARTKRNAEDRVSVRVRITNVGAGHYLPTTPTPAAFVQVELVDADKRRIAGAVKEDRIGRHLIFDKGFVEVEDTRIAPGKSFELAAAWTKGQVAKARFARIRVRVEPDEYYERFYQRRLGSKGFTSEERELFLEALRRTRESHYLAYDEVVPVEGWSDKD